MHAKTKKQKNKNQPTKRLHSESPNRERNSVKCRNSEKPVQVSGQSSLTFFRLLSQPRAHQTPPLSWHCVQDETKNFPCQRGTKICCHSLHMLGTRCFYLSTYQRKLPAIRSCNTTAREGSAALWKEISNFSTNRHYKALGKKEKKKCI